MELLMQQIPMTEKTSCFAEECRWFPEKKASALFSLKKIPAFSVPSVGRHLIEMGEKTGKRFYIGG